MGSRVTITRTGKGKDSDCRLDVEIAADLLSGRMMAMRAIAPQ